MRRAKVKHLRERLALWVAPWLGYARGGTLTPFIVFNHNTGAIQYCENSSASSTDSTIKLETK